MAATDEPNGRSSADDLDLGVETDNLKTFGLKMQTGVDTFIQAVAAAGVRPPTFSTPKEFVEMAEFTNKLLQDTQEAIQFTTDMADGLQSYGGAAIVSFNKYGYGDDQARLSLQDVRDAMQATKTSPTNASAV